MAKKKQELNIRDCKECINAISKERIYCKLYLQDTNVLKDSAVVTKKECNYFKKILTN